MQILAWARELWQRDELGELLAAEPLNIPRDSSFYPSLSNVLDDMNTTQRAADVFRDKLRKTIVSLIEKDGQARFAAT